jgi:pimeloyl-ACP methyl ester carboxylesterase
MDMAIRFDRGEGHPVVLLHGFPGGGADWVPAASVLAETFRVVVVDLIGFGSSSRPRNFADLWVDSQAEALAATLDGLGLDQAALIGHDYGGPIALTLVRRFPERVSHLGLLSTNAFGDTPVDFPLSLLKLPMVGPLLDSTFFNTVALGALGGMASKTGGVRPHRNDPGEARSIRIIFGRVLRELAELYGPLEASLGDIEVPTVVMWGDRDMFFAESQGRRTADAIPGARFVLFEGAGHFLPIERTKSVVDEVTKLLSDERSV